MWSSKITRQQKNIYYLIGLLAAVPVVVSAFLMENARTFSVVVFLVLGLSGITQGIYAGFYLKEYPKDIFDIMKLTGLSAVLRGILSIILGIVALFMSANLYFN